VSRHEVAAVHEAALNGLGAAPLYAQILADVVTAVAISLGVTGLAQALLLHRFGAVMAHEPAFVAQEGLRHEALEVTVFVTGRALPGPPLLFVLVTAKALAHWRQGRLSRLNHPAVAAHALPPHCTERQMTVVLEGDGPVGSRRWSRDHGPWDLGVGAMAARALVDARHRLPSPIIGERVA
jgi:hypothetical protein